MQKAFQGGRPQRGAKQGAATGTHEKAPAPDLSLDPQERDGSKVALGMVGGERETAALAGGRPIGRMVEWTPQRGGETKVQAVFPPETRVTMDDVATIGDRWGLRVERWEMVNRFLHIEFVTRAPQELFAWGAEIILGQPPPETVLEQVQESPREGRGLLAAASAGLAAVLLSPASQAAPPGLAAPAPGQAAAPAGGALGAGLLAAALGTPAPAPAQAAPGAAPAQKARGLEALLLGAPTPAPAPAAKVDPEAQAKQAAEAFQRELSSGSPAPAALRQLAAGPAAARLFPLLAQQLAPIQVERLAQAARGDALCALLEARLYPLLGGAQQRAWDGALGEGESAPAAAPQKPVQKESPAKA